MKIWICTKCNQMIPSNSTPYYTNCPAGGTHVWNVLTSDGDVVPRPNLKVWQCKRCGIIIYSKHMPNAVRCLKTRGGHVWVPVT